MLVDGRMTHAGPEPLSPFEHLMLVDARPGHPMCFTSECIVEGELDRARLRLAVDEASRRHPRLCSRVAWIDGRPCWLPPDVSPAVVWSPMEEVQDAWRAIDLGHESGVRFVVRPLGVRRHGIVMVVHHSACDGIAACEFLGDVWACYHGVTPPPLAATVGSAEHGSATISAGLTKRRSGKEPAVDVLKEAWSFACFRPSPLAWRRTAADDPTREPGEPPFATIQLDAQASARLRAAATSRAATLNDVIVAAAMRAAVRWNDRHGRSRGGVRVTLPVSIRPPRRRAPACNGISYAFLDRSRVACADREALLGSLAKASRWILASGVVQGFVETIRFLARHPWMLRAATRAPVCLSTITVSNVGDVSRRMRAGVPTIAGRDAPGGLVIEGFRGVPPLRPQTRAALGVMAYAGTTTISCLCSAGPDPRAAAERFLEALRDELDHYC